MKTIDTQNTFNQTILSKHLMLFKKNNLLHLLTSFISLSLILAIMFLPFYRMELSYYNDKSPAVDNSFFSASLSFWKFTFSTTSFSDSLLEFLVEIIFYGIFTLVVFLISLIFSIRTLLYYIKIIKAPDSYCLLEYKYIHNSDGVLSLFQEEGFFIKYCFFMYFSLTILFTPVFSTYSLLTIDYDFKVCILGINFSTIIILILSCLFMLLKIIKSLISTKFILNILNEKCDFLTSN